MKPVKKIAVIHDICGIGKAAMANIVPILSVMGIEVCQIPTMLLSTHTGGYGKPYIQSVHGYMMGCLEHYLEQGIKFDMIFVGYIGTMEQIQEVKQFLTKYTSKYPDVTIVLDPIFGDNGSCYSNFTMEYVKQMRTLLSYADIIVPNYTEYSLLFNVNIDTEYNNNNDLLSQWNKSLDHYNIKNAVITSVPINNKDEIGILIMDYDTVDLITFKKCSRSYHGTGDIFAAVLCGSLIQGDNLLKACQRAHTFVVECLEESDKFQYDQREGVILEPLLKKLLK